MSLDSRKRRSNEKKFGQWSELADGWRRYWYDVPGHLGWTARYLKEVDAAEQTVRFGQEIYDEHGRLIEVDEKFPQDEGHRRTE